MNRSPLHWLTSDISQWDPDICHKISWKTSQASRLYSLVTEVDQPGICGDIWNHHSVSSIVHILWAAKCTHHKKGQMVCCWKGMENSQCGSQNHHVCHIAWLKAYLHYLWWMWDQGRKATHQQSQAALQVIEWSCQNGGVCQLELTKWSW